MNPDLKLPYDDIDLQHVMMGHHWYVSGYMMSLLDPASEQTRPLFTDAEPAQTMFRVVVKADVTRPMIEHLLISFKSALRDMDEFGHGFKDMHRTKGPQGACRRARMLICAGSWGSDQSNFASIYGRCSQIPTPLKFMLLQRCVLVLGMVEDA